MTMACYPDATHCHLLDSIVSFRLFEAFTCRQGFILLCVVCDSSTLIGLLYKPVLTKQGTDMALPLESPGSLQ